MAIVGKHSPRILMVAGEVSGDAQGALLARAIRARSPAAILYGSGGERMAEAGVVVRVETVRYGSVGFQESLRYLWPLHRVMLALRRIIRTEPPDVAVLIDNEGFNAVLARFLQRSHVPIISYFPPQLWLWGSWRRRTIVERATAVIAAFPPEAEIYRSRGARVECFGHPLLDVVRPDPDGRSTLRRLGLDPDGDTVCLMPGSRRQEIRTLAPAMMQAARLLGQRRPELQFVLPLAAPYLRPAVEEAVHRSRMHGRVRIVDTGRYTCISRACLVITASGTATLETALLGTPMVVAYRVHPLTAVIARRLLEVPFIAMPNILLNQAVVPEFLQENVSGQALAEASLEILENPARRQWMIERLGRVRQALGSPGALTRAAKLILEEAEGRSSRAPVTGR